MPSKNKKKEEKHEEVFKTELAKQTKKEGKDEKTVLVLIPLTIPGVGKTTFNNMYLKPLCSNLGFDFHSVSNDFIRHGIIDTYKKKHPKASSDEAHEATTNDTSKEFIKELKNLVQQV